MSRRDVPHLHLVEIIMQTAIIIPISKKAKNRFANLMNKNEICIIEQQLDDRVFLTSMNGKYHFWVMLNHDKDWMIKEE